jgi:DNA-directed RNA polymerase specialized sigma24 family protein
MAPTKYDAHGTEPIAQLDFATTHWTVVLKARDRSGSEASAALAQLCETYWYPLYAYVRRRIADVHEAQDFTQAFFAHLLEKAVIANADAERGRFRAFLLTACQRFLINGWQKARAVKRGGGRRPLSLDFDSGESKLGLVAIETLTAEQVYEQQWAITLLERVMERLRAEYAAKERSQYFEALKPLLAGSSQQIGYADAARSLRISEATARVAGHRMRQRYRELLRSEIANVVERPEDIDDEIRALFTALGAEKS